MWMVEGNDHGKLEFKISADRKLRPLMPRPISSCSTTSSPFSALSNPSCFCTHNPNILPSWNHHPIGGVSDYGVKREMPLVSTRWNPTPEQLQALEEMYRRGTRTPSAEQIQQIAAKLRRFGKIEGKNVFYWFQNHKARERQKKRRQLELQLSGKKQTELRSRRYFEIEHHKKLSASPSNCSAPSEGSAASMQNGTGIAECKKGEWTQLGQKINVIAAKNESSCWKLDLSSPNNNSSLLHTINATPKYSALEQENTKPFAASSLNLSMLLSPKNDDISIVDERSSEIRENRTLLQLFPTGSVDSSFRNATREEAVIHDVSTRFTPNHEFIEFLPTKN